METRICKKCGIEKELTEEFFRQKGKYFAYECRECAKIYQKIYNAEHKNERKIYRKRYYNENKEEILGNLKLLENRKKQRSTQKKFRETHKEGEKIRKKKYNEKHKEEITTYKREYRNKNRKTISAKICFKIKNDPNARLRHFTSAMIRRTLKKSGHPKNNKSITKYLQYTLSNLRIHIENQFEWWMTWKNYGAYNSKIWNNDDQTTWTWQIDHIIPQSDLPYISMEDDNFKKCWALNNLRPLSSKQNLLDGTRKVRHKKY